MPDVIRMFFDILEEVIKREDNSIETVVGFRGLLKQRNIGRKTNELMNE
jgi:hypothetical protein